MNEKTVENGTQHKQQASNQTSILAWVELICVILLNMSINLRWLTFSPVATIASKYMAVNISAITWLANCATLIYIAISASTGWVFERYGMKTCVWMLSNFLICFLFIYFFDLLLVFIGCCYQHYRLMDTLFWYVCPRKSKISHYYVWTGKSVI